MCVGNFHILTVIFDCNVTCYCFGSIASIASAKKEAEHLLQTKNNLEQMKDVELWQNDLEQLKKALLKEGDYTMNVDGQGSVKRTKRKTNKTTKTTKGGAKKTTKSKSKKYM